MFLVLCVVRIRCFGVLGSCCCFYVCLGLTCGWYCVLPGLGLAFVFADCVSLLSFVSG